MDLDPVPDIDTTRPHPARIYDYGLGGKNHFAADREIAEKVLAAVPSLRVAARENRAFLGRAVRFLAGDAGIRQFLDIGAGLPTADAGRREGLDVRAAYVHDLKDAARDAVDVTPTAIVGSSPGVAGPRRVQPHRTGQARCG